MHAAHRCDNFMIADRRKPELISIKFDLWSPDRYHCGMLALEGPPMNWMLMPYYRYFEFTGRSRRMEYWMFTLFTVLVVFAIVAVGLTVAGAAQSEDLGMTIGYIGLGLFILASFIPGLAVQVRRFHDQNLTGWLVLLGFIPYVGGLIIIVFMCIDGTKGPNQYGADPKGGVDPNVFS